MRPDYAAIMAHAQLLNIILEMQRMEPIRSHQDTAARLSLHIANYTWRCTPPQPATATRLRLVRIAAIAIGQLLTKENLPMQDLFDPDKYLSIITELELAESRLDPVTSHRNAAERLQTAINSYIFQYSHPTSNAEIRTSLARIAALAILTMTDVA